MEAFVFGVLALLTISTALLVIVLSKPLYSALALLVAAGCVAGLFVLMEAHFLAIGQLVVYVGMIAVYLLFMDVTGKPHGRLRRGKVRLLAVGFLGLLPLLGYGLLGVLQHEGEVAANGAAVAERSLLSAFFLPVGIAALLFSLALVGSVFLARGESYRPEMVDSMREE